MESTTKKTRIYALLLRSCHQPMELLSLVVADNLEGAIAKTMEVQKKNFVEFVLAAWQSCELIASDLPINPASAKQVPLQTNHFKQPRSRSPRPPSEPQPPTDWKSALIQSIVQSKDINLLATNKNNLTPAEVKYIEDQWKL